MVHGRSVFPTLERKLLCLAFRKQVIVEGADPAISAMQDLRSFGTRGGGVLGTLWGLERDLKSTIYFGWRFSAKSERLPRNRPGERWRSAPIH
jgi:hypothetical protein